MKRCGCDDRDHLGLGRRPRGSQDRGDFDRMVAVIVIDRDAIPCPSAGEAPANAAKPGDRLADDVDRRAKLVRDRNRGRGVEGVVAAGHWQREIIDEGGAARRPIADQRRKSRDAAGKVDVHQAHIGLRILAIGENAAVFDLADEFLHGRMIETHDREAIERQVSDQRQKGVLDGVEGLEVVEVLGIDVGDDGDVGGELQERAVALVGLDHHPVAGPEPRVGAIGVDDAAVDHRRIKPGGVEQRRHQRSRRGLAMRAGHGHALFQPHQLGQHLGPANDGNAPRPRLDHFGIIALHGGRNDDHRRAAEIGLVMADEDGRALLAQALDVGVVAQVRALNLMAKVEKHLGDARHANAADADEVDGADLVRQFHAFKPSAGPSPGQAARTTLDRIR